MAPARYALLISLFGCGPGSIAVEDLDEVSGDGWAEGPWEDWDTGDEDASSARWSGARLRIQSPESGAYVISGEEQPFEAVIEAPNGDLIPWTDITWASEATSWTGTGDVFTDAELDIGLHEIVAEARLPNGEVVYDAIDNVKVQSFGSGLYAGTFAVDGSFNAIQFGCVGSDVITVEPHGTEGTGSGDCLVSLLGFGELPLSFVIDLDIDPTTGVVSGTCGADLFGWFTYDFLTEGQLRPLDGGFDLTFSGDVPLVGPIEAWLTADRISLDSVPEVP
jgi:hypothetical protein